MNFDSFFDQQLSDVIKFGVKLYTRNFDSINNKLRNGESLSVIENIVLKCLFIAYNHVKPLTSELVVYRGTRDFKDIKNNSFISTSLSRRIAKSFMVDEDGNKLDCCIFTITIPIGVKCLPILNNTYYMEQEILLPPESTFTEMSPFDLIYNPPINPPDFKLSKWDEYLLTFFNNISSFGFKIEILDNILIKEYIPALISLINTENLANRFHMNSNFVVVVDDNIKLWKDIIHKFGIELLQLIKVINLANNREFEILDYTPNVDDMTIDTSTRIFAYINNLNLLKTICLNHYRESEIPEICNLNLKKFIISNSSIEGVLDLSKLNLINLESLVLRKVHVIGDIIIKNLIDLVLTDCDVDHIPLGVYELSSLKILSLKYNNIKYVSDNINNLQSLNILDIRHNPLERFPSINIPMLKKVSISYNTLINVDNNLDDLKKVGIVELAYM